MYHGIARSNGQGYWPSVAYTFAASALWEIAGETTPPSRNDQIASGIAGSFFGEPLFRISRLVLDRADRGPGVWRTLGAVLASPPTGLNHMLVGDAGGIPGDRRRAVLRHPRADRRHRHLRSGPAQSCPPWPRPNRDSRCRWTTAIRETPAIATTPVRLLQDREQRLDRGTGAVVHARPDRRGRLRSRTSQRRVGPLWHLRLLRA